MRQPQASNSAGEHDGEAKQESADHRYLDPAGVLSTLSRWCVLGDIDRRTAIFATKRQALQEPKPDEQYRRPNASTGIGRQEPDCCGRPTHQRDRHQESVFAPDQIAEIPKDQCPDRSHAEPGTECRKACQRCRSRIVRREEQPPEQRRQNAVKEEIIPFEHRAERRCDDYKTITLRIEHGRRGAGLGYTCFGHRVPR